MRKSSNYFNILYIIDKFFILANSTFLITLLPVIGIECILQNGLHSFTKRISLLINNRYPSRSMISAKD